MTLQFIRPDYEQDIFLIQPYLSQKQQAKTIKVCINVMMDIRKNIGLEAKEKGRPKGIKKLFKGEKQFPEAVEQAIERLQRDVRVAKALASIKDEDKKQELKDTILPLFNTDTDQIDIITEQVQEQKKIRKRKQLERRLQKQQ